MKFESKSNTIYIRNSGFFLDSIKNSKREGARHKLGI